jgi:hypothetical protein
MAVNEQVLLDIMVNDEDAIKNIVRLKNANEELKASLKDIKKEVEAKTKTEEDLAKATVQATAQMKANNDAIRENGKEIKANNQNVASASDSINGMRARVADLTKAFNSLSAEARDSDVGKAISDELKQLNEGVNAANKSVSNFKDNVGNYKNSILEAVESLSALKVETAEMEKEQKALAISSGKNTQEYRLLSKAIEDNKKEMLALGDSSTRLDKISNSLSKVEGPAGNVIQSIKGVSKSFTELVMNPVGAVLVAIAASAMLLYQAFQRNEESTQKLSRLMGGLSGAFNGFLKVIEPVANFIADKLVSGFESAAKGIDNLVGMISKGLKAIGLESASKGLDDLSKSMKEGAEAGKKLADAEFELQKMQRESRKIQLEYQRLAEKQRQIRDDESKSIPERIKANERLGEVLKKQSADELRIANEAVKVAKMRIDLNGRTTENLDALAEKETEVIDIKERITGQESEQLVNLNSLRKEYSAQETKRREEEKKALEERARTMSENVQMEIGLIQQKAKDSILALNEELEFRKKSNEIILAEEERMKWAKADNLYNELATLDENSARATEIKKEQLDMQMADEIKAAATTGASTLLIEKKYANEKKKLDDIASAQKLDQAQRITNGLASLFGKATKAGKLAAAASVAIDTYKGATAAIASMAGAGPIGWALGAVEAGVIVASGVKSINDIYAVSENGGTPSAPTTPTSSGASSGGGSGSNTPNYSTGSNLSSLYSTNVQQNEVAQTIASSQPAPIVKVTDITNMQTSVAVKENSKL